MWIMTKDGWKRIATVCTTVDSSPVSDRIRNGYVTRDPKLMLGELVAMVIPERYTR